MNSTLEPLSILKKTAYFTEEQRKQIDQHKVPVHVAFIPDGNRRWAQERTAGSQEGHREGGETLMDTIKAACELNIKVVTFFLFSTENWGRPDDEINALMWLLYNFLVEQRATMLQYGIRVCTIGELSALPDYVQATIAEAKAETAHCKQLDFVMALNYGGRNELTRAMRSIARDCNAKKLLVEDINESVITSYLDTASWPDPDLLIRTSGEMRISNYLLWQISYTEVYCSEVLWPDFQPLHLLEAIVNFQKRQRRLGRI